MIIKKNLYLVQKNGYPNHLRYISSLSWWGKAMDDRTKEKRMIIVREATREDLAIYEPGCPICGALSIPGGYYPGNSIDPIAGCGQCGHSA